MKIPFVRFIFQRQTEKLTCICYFSFLVKHKIKNLIAKAAQKHSMGIMGWYLSNAA